MKYFYTTMNEKMASGYIYECSATTKEAAEKEVIAKFEALATADKKENVYSLCSWSDEEAFFKYFNEFDSLEFEEQEELLAALQRREEESILTISYDNEIKIER